MKAVFGFTVDNAQLALDEVELQIQSLGLTPQNMEIIDDTELEKEDEDWFDDFFFQIYADVVADGKSDEEIRKILEDGPFESFLTYDEYKRDNEIE